MCVYLPNISTLYRVMIVVCVFVLVAMSVHGSSNSCTDIDDIFCAAIVKKIPEVCGDFCLAKYCQRSCGICSLECYACSSIDNISNCSSVSVCPNINDVCFAAQTFTDRFQETYKIGCGSRETCMQYSQRHGGHVEAGCCDTNRCNNKPPSLLHLSRNVSTHNSIVSNANTCMNKDDTICLLLPSYVTDPCADDCIASKLCPKMCQTCFSCLNCTEIKSPDLCKETTMCDRGQVCYGFEKLGSDFLPVYQLGCINKQECVRLGTSPAFGKRDFNINGYCCKGDKCNVQRSVTTSVMVSSLTSLQPKTKQTTIQQTTTTTSQPTFSLFSTTRVQTSPSSCKQQTFQQSDCPPFYNQYINNTCYHKGSDTEYVPRAEAEQRCRKQCGTLLYFDSLDEMRHMLQSLNYYIYGDLVIWIDMEKNSAGHWIWTHDNSPVSKSILTAGMLRHSYGSCAVAYLQFKENGQHPLDIKSVGCTEYHRTLCRHL